MLGAGLSDHGGAEWCGCSTAAGREAGLGGGEWAGMCVGGLLLRQGVCERGGEASPIAPCPPMIGLWNTGGQRGVPSLL